MAGTTTATARPTRASRTVTNPGNDGSFSDENANQIAVTSDLGVGMTRMVGSLEPNAWGL